MFIIFVCKSSSFVLLICIQCLCSKKITTRINMSIQNCLFQSFPTSNANRNGWTWCINSAHKVPDYIQMFFFYSFVNEICWRSELISPECRICASMNRVNIGPDNALSPIRRQAIIWNQCWIIVNWTLRNKLQWNFNRHIKLFTHENAFENIVCEMAPFCPVGRWVKLHNRLVSI